jgi:hypothetical protein
MRISDGLEAREVPALLARLWLLQDGVAGEDALTSKLDALARVPDFEAAVAIRTTVEAEFVGSHAPGACAAGTERDGREAAALLEDVAPVDLVRELHAREPACDLTAAELAKRFTGTGGGRQGCR